jgi:xylulokinase
VVSAASARGAALLAGVASGAYRTIEDTLPLAPEPDRTIRPGEAAYEGTYARYRELYPRLRG